VFLCTFIYNSPSAFPKLSHIYLLLSPSLYLQPPTFKLSAHVRRQSGVANFTSPRRPTVNHLFTPRRPSAAVAPTPPHSLVNPSLSSSPLSASIALSLEAQNLPFQQIPPTLTFLLYSLDCLYDNGTGPNLSCSSVYF